MHRVWAELGMKEWEWGNGNERMREWEYDTIQSHPAAAGSGNCKCLQPTAHSATHTLKTSHVTSHVTRYVTESVNKRIYTIYEYILYIYIQQSTSHVTSHVTRYVTEYILYIQQSINKE